MNTKSDITDMNKLTTKHEALANIPRSPIEVGDSVIVTINPKGYNPTHAVECVKDTTSNAAYDIVDTMQCLNSLLFVFIDGVGDAVGIQEEHLTKII